MLAAVGVASLDELFASIPEEVRFAGRLDLPEPAAEADVLRELAALAGRNRPAGELVSFLGAGIYDTYVPAVVDAVTSRSEFLTVVHALPGRAQPGRAAGDLRVPDGDLRADRARREQRLDVRRRHGAGRGRHPRGRPRQPAAAARSSSPAACTPSTCRC